MVTLTDNQAAMLASLLDGVVLRDNELARDGEPLQDVAVMEEIERFALLLRAPHTLPAAAEPASGGTARLVDDLAASAQPVAPVAAPGEPSNLASVFQEFIYRVVSQVPFEHAAWANERAAALMQEIKRLTSQAEREPVGWFVQGENTYLYTNVPEKPNFACINGGDKVICIEPRYAPSAQVERHSVGHVRFKNNCVTDIVSREVNLSGEYDLVPRTK